jgi:alkyl hydroperoxide reductase subunit AhpC
MIKGEEYKYEEYENWLRLLKMNVSPLGTTFHCQGESIFYHFNPKKLLFQSETHQGIGLNLELLFDDCWSIIFSFLMPKDFISFCSTNSNFRSLLNESHWKRMTNQIFLLGDEFKTSNWEETLKNNYSLLPSNEKVNNLKYEIITHVHKKVSPEEIEILKLAISHLFLENESF